MFGNIKRGPLHWVSLSLDQQKWVILGLEPHSWVISGLDPQYWVFLVFGHTELGHFSLVSQILFILGLNTYK